MNFSFSRIGISITVRLFVVILALTAGLSLCSCQIKSSESDQRAKGLQLIKEKKYAEAEALFQDVIERQERKLDEIKTAEKSEQQKSLGLMKNQQTDQGKLLAVSYHSLATVLYESGKYQEAESAYEKAIHTYRQYFGRQHHFVMDCLNSLAASYYKQGKYLDAERYYLEELELEKKLLKSNSLALAVTANNLAAIYQKLGDEAEAEKYFQRSLNLCQNCKGSDQDQDQLADILNNLAVFYEKGSNYQDAKNMVNRALKLENKRTGEAFLVDRVRSLLVLASIDKATDLDLDASEAHYKEAINLIDTELGGRPDLACDALEKYAELLLSQRKFTDAEPVFERSVKTCIEAHGPEHPSVADRLSEFSVLLRRAERYAEAESMLKRALSIQEKTVGVDTSAYLTTVHRLASVLSDQNRCQEADALYREVLPKLKVRLGPSHPFVADTMDNWADYVERCRSKEDADELRAGAKVIRRKIAHSLRFLNDPEQR